MVFFGVNLKFKDYNMIDASLYLYIYSNMYISQFPMNFFKKFCFFYEQSALPLLNSTQDVDWWCCGPLPYLN